MADEGSEQTLLNNLHIIQSMIDVSAERLEGLRTQCATSAELTQQEIRTLEGKLIKLFSDQLVTKLKLKNGCDEHIPSLKQWLQVVGLGKDSIFGLCQKISSVEELQEKSEHELRTILNDKSARPEELSRLCRALHNLKRYTDVLKRGDKDASDMHLYWDSWDRHHQLKGMSPRPGRSRAARASVPSEESLLLNNNRGGANIPPSSSVSSINSLNAQNVLGPPLTPPGQNRGKGMKFPTTPPAKRKHLTGNPPALIPDSYPLTKSKSHESQLAASKGENETNPTNGTGTVGRRARLPTEPGPETMGYASPILTSPIKSPPYSNTAADNDNTCKPISLQVPKSPRTPPVRGRIMTHQINHRFTKTFKMMSTCEYCLKQIYFGTGLKCKECKYTCHRDCEDKVAPSCGLPPELLDEFKKNLSIEGQVFISPTSGRSRNAKNIMNSLTRCRNRKSSHPQPLINTPPFPPPDSSSNTSSCNSSTPSSPAVQTLTTPHASHKPTFHFPDITHSEANEVTLETHPLPITTTLHHDLTSSQQSRESERTASQTSGSTSTDSDRTPVRVDSQDSQVSDTETITDGHRWPRQNSLSMREWDIPFDELKMNEVIGTGRFGTVHRGYWHGDVAVKVLNVNYLKDEKTLEQFKNEVSTFRKTRHENLILFMGACMKPPKLAIVTSLSKGMTLYTHIHLRKDKFNMNKTTIVAQQISQGMGYLHAKGIVHKDLKSKNIFVENGKVVITDFGLFSVTKLCFGNRKLDSLGIPPGWLCYLAPEIMRSLHAHQPHDEELPFSKASDVYAFGTVWYELLCGEWPFKGQPPEAIIWQVGKGMKQPLANLQASRDVKDILMLCWSFRPGDRPDFIRLLNILDKLPKKRLARSPSHPIHLSRSAESVF
ncbi:kinase suppressor of Ras 2 isoform X2 [Anoplophora glabripennis]|nr:kinase suppressor of Ras 2 isoform X2 [Anoplophora glabripennis]